MSGINIGGGSQQQAIADLMAQMQRMRQQAQHTETTPLTANNINGLVNEGGELNQAKTDVFANYLNDAVNNVNSLQKDSAAKATAFELGDKSVSLSEVMIASQKSGIAFQAATQVRNRVVQAYQDVMNMPI